MPKLLTAPDRLRLLLPWLNGAFDESVVGPNPIYGQADPYGSGEGPEDVFTWTDFPAVRRALAYFIKSFDGSANAAYVVAEPDDTVDALNDDAIGDLEARLNILLEQGFGEPSLQHPVVDPVIASLVTQGPDLGMPLGSLRMTVRGAGRQQPKKRGSITDGGVAALRRYRAPGAYVLRVQGSLLDLVPFLLMQLLTAPEMVAVKRCERIGCGHFVVESGTKGRPQRFCSAACREWNREHQQQRKARRTR